MIAPICPYCNAPAQLKDSAIVYYTRSYGNMWVCSNYPSCDAYVGVHKATNEALGTLANKELRQARMKAKELFEPIWKTGQINKHMGLPYMKKTSNRKKAYRWLADKMGLTKDETHFGMFNKEQCEKAYAILYPYQFKRAGEI